MKQFILICIFFPFLAGCQGMFGTIPGEHWRITLGASDQKLDPDSARKIGSLIAARLHLELLSIVPESNGYPYSFVDLSGSSKSGSTSVTIYISRRESAVGLSTRYFGKSSDRAKIEQLSSEEVRAILKELFPASTEAPFIAYRGLLGP